MNRKVEGNKETAFSDVISARDPYISCNPFRDSFFKPHLYVSHDSHHRHHINLHYICGQSNKLTLNQADHLWLAVCAML